jgi:dephospho-CoA kinase
MFFVGRKLKNVRLIGLTGGIATGKSTLVKQIKKNLEKLKIIDCDEIAK